MSHFLRRVSSAVFRRPSRILEEINSNALMLEWSRKNRHFLTQLDALLVGGSLLIFDEFYSSSHEFQAFYDYTKSYLRRYRVLAAVGRDPCLKTAIYLE